MAADSQPILIGVGQETWRDKDPQRTPIDALQAVVSKAASDTGSAKTLSAVDALVHIPFILNQVAELAPSMPRSAGMALAERLGIAPAQYTADVGGNLPQQLVNDFAARLSRGEHQMVLLCGVELLATFLGTLRSKGELLDWSGEAHGQVEQLGETPTMTAPSELAHGLFEPINAYPLFESALRHAKGLDEEAHRQRLGSLISAMSEVAAENPHAWKPHRVASDEVLSVEGGNRMISAPYTKIMNSLISVDQAAAVIMTTVGQARKLGIDEARWIYLRGASAARDSWFLSERQELDGSPALRLAARSALDQAALTVDDLSHFDLYSCFPSAVQVACDALGIAIDDPRGLTVTGGMSLFGGPGNNYSLHAIAEMVERLRTTHSGAGLVSANGGYLTKHAVGIYAREAGIEPWAPHSQDGVQLEVRADEGPRLADHGEGAFRLEAHTVKYQGAEPELAIVLGRLADNRRCLAQSRDREVMETLASKDCVSQMGHVSAGDGINSFRF